MNSGRKLGCNSLGVSGQLRHFAIAKFGSCQIRCNARKPEAGGAPFQPMQHFTDADRRLQGKVAQPNSQLFTKRQQALLAEQGKQLGNALLIDILHGASPR